MIVKALGLALANISAPLVALVSTPIVTRYYEPDAFGQYFYLLSLATVLALVITTQTFHGVYAEKSATGAKQLYTESVIVACVLAVIAAFLFGIVGVFSPELAHSTFPLSIVWMSLGVGLNQIQLAYLSRTDQLRLIGMMAFSKALLLVSLQIAFAVGGRAHSGALANATICSEILAFLVSAFIGGGIDRGSFLISIRSRFSRTKKNVGFFYNYLPTQIISLSINFLPIFVLKGIGEVLHLGLYSMTLRLVATPVNAFASSLRSIYWRWLNKSRRPVYKTTRDFFLISIVGAMFFPLLLWGSGVGIASRFLGSAWSMVDEFLPFSLLWLLSSLAAVFPSEVLKNNARQSALLRGEVIASFIKIVAIAGALFAGNVGMMLKIWFIACFLSNFLNSLSYCWRIRQDVSNK